MGYGLVIFFRIGQPPHHQYQIKTIFSFFQSLSSSLLFRISIKFLRMFELAPSLDVCLYTSFDTSTLSGRMCHSTGLVYDRVLFPVATRCGDS